MLLIIKTRSALLNELTAHVNSNHPYEWVASCYLFKSVIAFLPCCWSHLGSPWKVDIFLTWNQSRLNDTKFYSAPFATLGLSSLEIMFMMLQHLTYFYLCESVYLDGFDLFPPCVFNTTVHQKWLHCPSLVGVTNIWNGLRTALKRRQ